MRLAIIALIALLTATAHAVKVRIDIVVLNDAGTATNAASRISISPADSARLQAAVDAQDGEGTSLDRLKRRLVQRMKELVLDYEQQAVRQQYISEMIEAEQAVTEIGAE
jgi:hypothetical protein